MIEKANHLSNSGRIKTEEKAAPEQTKARPASGGHQSHYSREANKRQSQVKRPQRPSDINRKSSRQSSEFYRSTSQISHEQAATRLKPEGSSSASVILNKDEQAAATKVVDHMKTTTNQIDSSDYENGDGQYEEVGDEDYDQDEADSAPPQQHPLQYGSSGSQRRSSLLMAPPLNELKENVKETDGEDDEEYSEVGEENLEDNQVNKEENYNGTTSETEEKVPAADDDYSDDSDQEVEETKAPGGLTRATAHVQMQDMQRDALNEESEMEDGAGDV